MKQFVITSIAVCFLVCLFVSVFPQVSDAIPAFARKYQADCNMCHVAWPQLNKVGRNFKENGYKLSFNEESQEVISDFLQWDKHVPITAVIVSRPYDDKRSDVRKVRALHEVELMVAGVLYKNVSGFIEIEAEDEEDFDPEIPIGVFGYHPFQFLNIQLGYTSLLWADPYDTFAPHRRLTRGSYSPIDQVFGGQIMTALLEIHVN